MSDPKPAQPHHILFLDGECLFCQQSAQLLYRWDRSRQIYFAPLQGETAQALPEDWKRLTDSHGNATGTAVFAENFGTPDARYWRGADAPLRSLKVSGGVCKVFWLLSYTPRPIKDWVYQSIARNRHRLLRKKGVCAIPDELFKARMLP